MVCAFTLDSSFNLHLDVYAFHGIVRCYISLRLSFFHLLAVSFAFWNLQLAHPCVFTTDQLIGFLVKNKNKLAVVLRYVMPFNLVEIFHMPIACFSFTGVFHFFFFVNHLALVPVRVSVAILSLRNLINQHNYDSSLLEI